MTFPSWPSTLPQAPLAGGQSLDRLASGVIETEFEAGNVEQRAVTAARISLVSIKYLMTSAQYALFESFVVSTLNLGTSRFTVPFDDYSSSFKSVEAQIVQGASGIKSERRGAYISVSFQLRIYR